MTATASGVRFNPGEAGRWTWRGLYSSRTIPELVGEGSFDVTERATRGFLKATPGEAWGFATRTARPLLPRRHRLMTCSACITAAATSKAARRRARLQLLRCRLPISRFHPPGGYSEWHTKRLWPWGVRETPPRLISSISIIARRPDRAADRRHGHRHREMIMGAGVEFPFNHRAWFTHEMRGTALADRPLHDAYAAVHFYCPTNTNTIRMATGTISRPQIAGRFLSRAGSLQALHAAVERAMACTKRSCRAVQGRSGSGRCHHVPGSGARDRDEERYGIASISVIWRSCWLAGQRGGLRRMGL